MAKIQRIDADPVLLEAALEGLENRKRQIEEQIRAVRAMLPSGFKRSGAKPAKRDLSPEARKRIAAAQRKRWAEYRRQAKAS